jgi:hypothetical protein
MKEHKQRAMLKKEHKEHIYLRWAPRMLGICLVLFLMLFSLDVFQPGATPIQIISGLLIHNIPAFMLLCILAISWKYEIIGGIFFILAGLTYIFLLVTNSHFEWYMMSWALVISGPALLIGILFIVSWAKKKKLH